MYIEYVIIDNMAFDSLILWASSKTLKISIPKWRVLLGGAVGTATAFVSVYLYDWWAFIVKTAMLVLMCFCTVGKRRTLLYIVTVAAYTFVTGGIIIALFYLTGVQFAYGAALTYDSVPLGLYLAGIAALVFFVNYVRQYVGYRKTLRNIVNVKIDFGNGTIDTDAFIDSGNSLTHEGVAVCFAMTPIHKQVVSYMAEALPRGKCVTVNYNTLTSSENTLAVAAEVVYKGRKRQVYIALPNKKTNAQYGLLLNSSFLEVEDETD